MILDDADLETAVSDGVAKCFLNSGQTCSAQTRMLVPARASSRRPRRSPPPSAERSRSATRSRRGTRLGPLVSDAQRERVRGYIEQGRRGGREARHRRRRAARGLDTGYFVRPTVFSDVRNDMTIAQEEIFGPVLSIIPYDDEDDAVEIANDTIYGLAGGVWSARPERAKAVARRMRTGQVEINGATFNPLAPFGGYKQSAVAFLVANEGIEQVELTEPRKRSRRPARRPT